MKVALFQPYYLGWGGTEKVAYDLARYLPEQGIGLKIVTPGKGVFTERLEQAGLPYEVLEAPEILNKFGGAFYSFGFSEALDFALKMLQYNWRLSRWIKKEKLDLVILNGARASVIAGLAPIFAKVPSVLYLHGYFHKVKKSKFESIVNMWTALWPTYYVAVSKGSINDFSAKLPIWLKQKLKNRCDVVYNWTAIQAFRNAAKEEDKPGPFHLGTLANIERRKGIHKLLEVATLLKGRELDFRLIIGGAVTDRVYFAELKDMVRSMDLEDIVEFRGFVDPAEFLPQLDVFLFASTQEGMPLAVIEAIASGLPIVAFDATGITEVLDNGAAGILIPSGNVDMMADAVALLLSDSYTRAQYARKALERSKLFSPDVQIHRLGTILKRWAKR